MLATLPTRVPSSMLTDGNLQAKTIVECDILTWGGDARWVVALRIEASNHIQSVNGPIY